MNKINKIYGRREEGRRREEQRIKNVIQISPFVGTELDPTQGKFVKSKKYIGVIFSKSKPD
jgi:hypothetical protein